MLCLILGIFAGLISILLIRVLYYIKDLFSEIPLQPRFKSTLEGLAIGVISFFTPGFWEWAIM
jgi:CIC family chloride channel protein